MATAARHNLTGLMLDYEPRHNYTQDHADRYAGFVAKLTKYEHVQPWLIMIAQPCLTPPQSRYAMCC